MLLKYIIMAVDGRSATTVCGIQQLPSPQTYTSK